MVYPHQYLSSHARIPPNERGCVYSLALKITQRAAILLYVDDLMAGFASSGELARLTASLKEYRSIDMEFPTKQNSLAFLGMGIELSHESEILISEKGVY